ncbi:50S ribosomal protein L23 [Candidatus Parcubacteria bacterium]|nr:MAG: 50S ribosomal protein L23 [Candidatus Parcubacteria bacterium]
MDVLREVIIKPVISEKSLKETDQNKYTFVVNEKANKNQIKDAVEKMFGVKVEKVYTSLVKGEKIRLTKYGRKKKKYSIKKARVKLEKGQKLDIFDQEKK